MKHIHLTRILSLVLALVLVLGVSPVVRAETQVLEDNPAEVSGSLAAAGSAPVLNATLDSYWNKQEIENNHQNNNTTASAYPIEFGYSILGSTKASDKYDCYKLTVSRQTHLCLTSISNSDGMIFDLIDSKGKVLEVCTFLGIGDGWNWDQIAVIIPSGTYYVRIYQTTSGSATA